MSSENIPKTFNEGVPGADKTTSGLEYEVFLSFRGSDTRAGFTDHLYTKLVDVGIRVFRDNEELRKGEKIGPNLLKGIEQSQIAMPIFSKGYATSKWCLKELAQIVECKKTVMPIFYDVTPTEVRNQTGDYENAFKLHEKYHDENTINTWRKALREVGELKGWDIQGGTQSHRQEGELVKEIANIILRELKKAYLVVTDYALGLEHHVDEILRALTTEINGEKIVGIYGMGGIGKTTLGKVIYNHLLPHFENHCFLANIRETCQYRGVEFLQKRLISDILNKGTSISDIDEGIEISERFSDKKVLLLLDDVDEILQVRSLMGKRNWFGSGSKIIITTRNKSILDSIKVDRCYELTGLASHHALQLLSQHAFRKYQPPEEYATLSEKIVEIAGGLPLALEVFGSLLCGKSIKAWESTVKIWEKVPHGEVSAKLRISFEALNNEQKQIFLDIACFFIGVNKRMPIYFWEEDQFPEEAIEVLQQMSLIKIKEDDSIWMHDQLRDLGREIVRQEHNEHDKRSRLWDQKEATKTFMRKLGGDNVRAIILNFESIERSISVEEFAKLPNLRFLDAVGSCYSILEWFNPKRFFQESPLIFSKLRWLKWHEFPHKYDTSNFSLEDLVILDLSHSKMESNWSGWSRVERAKNLKLLNLTGCTKLVKTPNFSSHLKLEHLILTDCCRLVEIDESISLLEHLVTIDLHRCVCLGKLPKVLHCTESLELLDIRRTYIQEIPNWAPMRRLKVFKFSHYKASDRMLFPDDVKEFIGGMVDCTKEFFSGFAGVQTLPESIGYSESLIELDLSGSKIIELPDTIGNLKNLKVLDVCYTPITKLPTTIGMLENLMELYAWGCFDLRDIPRLPQSLISLRVRCQETVEFPDLSNLTNLKNLELARDYEGDYPFGGDDPAPWCIGRLINLERLELHLGHTVSLHADLSALSQLRELKLSHCSKLQRIPELPPGLKILTIESCESLILLEIRNCKSLQKLDIQGCGLSEIDGLGRLENLTRLDIGHCQKLQRLEIHNCKSLQELTINHASNLSEINGLEMLENLTTLYICSCEKLQRLEIRNCKSLQELTIHGARNLSEINGLEMLENLTTLAIRYCEKLQRLEIRNCQSLQKLDICEDSNLSEIDGLEMLENLTTLEIWSCEKLERLPDLSNLKKLKCFEVSNGPKLIENA